MMRSSLCAVLALAMGVAAQSPLESTFVGGFVVTQVPSPITALFDTTIIEPTGVLVTQFDVNVNTVHGTNGQLGVWVTAVGGTHVGNEQNAAAWTQVGTASLVHGGGRVEFVLDTPFFLPAGTYGMALHCIEANPVYTNGTTQVPPLPNTYSTLEASFDMTSSLMRTSDVADPFGPGTGAGFSPRQPNIAMHYVLDPAVVDFTSDVQTGPSPLTVQFSSMAASSAPGGIIAYAWDFDNDGNVDSTVPNPAFQYTSCGTYTVSLTIIDANGALTETKTDYIVTDVVTPGFSNLLLSPGLVQFVDTSTPTPTAWEWDFDGDGVTDSTAQNPINLFTNICGEATVSLTVSLACQPPITVTRTIAVATTVESTFVGGLVTSQLPAAASNYFDVDVANPLGVTVCGMHVHSQLAIGTPLTVNLYQTEDTYEGKTEDASLWRLIASETVNSAGPGQRTFVPFPSPLHLANGSFGLCMEHVGDSPVYTNLGGPLVVENGGVTLTFGASQDGPAFTVGAGVFAPRVANVALHFQTSADSSAPGYGFIGAGCPGSLGTPTNTSSTQPELGGQATIEFDNLPFGIGVLALGVTRFDPSFDLTIIGMTDCPLHHTADATVTLVGAGTTASIAYPIPNNVSLIGAQVYISAISYDPGINPFDFAISDAAVMLVGQ